VYFPVRCVTSMLASMEGAGSRVEVATSGREGMAGVGAYLGARHSPGRTFIQIKGESWRMPVDAFLRHAQALPAFGEVLRRFAHALFVMASQSAACNRAHTPRQRCARWLLMSADRVGADDFVLTQEFLGHMLGERRPTVSKAAGELQMAGCIQYSRGHVVIRNRRKLEDAACDCYQFIRKEHEAVLRLPG
jgi:CRP-like cAMP-binding protein